MYMLGYNKQQLIQLNLDFSGSERGDDNERASQIRHDPLAGIRVSLMTAREISLANQLL